MRNWISSHSIDLSLVFLASILLFTAGSLRAREDSGRSRSVSDSSSWVQRVMGSVEKSEYSISWHDSSAVPGIDAGYMAPNRALGLRFAFAEDGLHITKRKSPSWVCRLRAAGISAGDTKITLDRSLPEPSENKVDYYLAGMMPSSVTRSVAPAMSTATAIPTYSSEFPDGRRVTPARVGFCCTSATTSSVGARAVAADSAASSAPVVSP